MAGTMFQKKMELWPKWDFNHHTTLWLSLVTPHMENDIFIDDQSSTGWFTELEKYGETFPAATSKITAAANLRDSPKPPSLDGLQPSLRGVWGAKNMGLFFTLVAL